MPSLPRLSFLAALATLVAVPAHAQVAEGGFETPALAANNFQYNPAGSAWTFASNSGIVNGPFSAFNTPSAAPEGNQVAFLQNPINYSPAVRIFQTITLPTTGQYELSYFVGGRNNFGCCQGNTVYDFVLDATQIATGTTSTGMAYVERSEAFSANAGTYTLAIQFDPTTPAGDNTAFFDAVRITAVSSVPEPGTVALLATGLAGLALAARRRRTR